MLFTHGGRSIENIPPTRETLKQHILKAALKKQCCYHNPTEWGSKSLMKNVSCFRAIYQMQKRPAGNLSNAVARNHAKTNATVASKNYSVQS